MMTFGKIAILFIFLWPGFIALSKPINSDIDLKWHIKKGHGTTEHYIITVDAGNVNRFIQLSELRFIIDFRDLTGNLISRDTIDFFQKPGETTSLHDSRQFLSGNNISIKTFTHSYGSGVTLKGISLFYHWYDTSMSMEPDPYEEKIIIKELIYGEGRADVSDPPK